MRRPYAAPPPAPGGHRPAARSHSTRPTETSAAAAPDRDPHACLAALHELEDEGASAPGSTGLRTVNTPAPLPEAHRHFPTLREAAPQILAFVTPAD
ncbi:hypothetical protein ACODT3_20840 [Streptomyces sp. 4.24]|uniref:hypothetical protein n=1 Tax=Streptomyces tritrimontium TaxID=3406573 RepID=UPI003BB60ECF